ncbi:MAG: hypothetical protein HY259_04825 [Chloroflexi bacterium]|nr:hypothetical protein [Chloroflexota bacterium]
MLNRHAIPVVRLPRHPLWNALYVAAWELIARETHPAVIATPLRQWDACAWLLTARYASGVLPPPAGKGEAAREWPAPDHSRGPARSRGDSCAPLRPYFYEPLQPGFVSPLFAWAEWEWYQAVGDRARLASALPYLIAQYRWRQDHRRGPSGLYWASPAEPCPDHAPREAAEWCDVSAQQALAAECIAQMAGAVGQPADEEHFRAEWAALRALINERCWHDGAQFYLDRRADGSPAPLKTAAGFWPLLAGVPDAGQARALAAHLQDTRQFWRVHVFSSLPADHPRYSDRGAPGRGSVWPLANYAMVKGLERYGLRDLAYRAADNHLTTLSHVYKETLSLWDYYAPDTIEPAGVATPDTFSWSALAPIALLTETLIGLRLDAPSQTLHWRPALREDYRIEGLRFGGGDVSLSATPTRATLSASAPLTLHLITPQGEQWLAVNGETTVSI